MVRKTDRPGRLEFWVHLDHPVWIIQSDPVQPGPLAHMFCVLVSPIPVKGGQTDVEAINRLLERSQRGCVWICLDHTSKTSAKAFLKVDLALHQKRRENRPGQLEGSKTLF